MRRSDQESALVSAVRRGDADAVESLLTSPGSREMLTAEGNDALQMAILEGWTEIAWNLLRSGVPVDRSPRALAPLLYAEAASGQVDLCSELIARGADVNGEADANHRPLRAASLHGHVEVTRLLLSHGACPGGTEPGSSAVHTAALFGHPHTVALLLQAGADPSSVPNLRKSAIEHCRIGWKRWPRRGSLYALVEAALRDGPDSVADSLSSLPAVSCWIPSQLKRRSKLIHAARHNDRRGVHACLAAGTAALVHAHEPIVALELAAMKGNLDIVQDLLSSGVDPSGGECLGGPPLHTATDAGMYDSVAALLKAGADPDGRDFFCRTPLLESPVKRDNRIAFDLIAYGADLDAQSGTGHSTLMAACYCANTAVVSALLAAGASTTLTDSIGRSAYTWAIRGLKRWPSRMTRYGEVMKILRTY